MERSEPQNIDLILYSSPDGNTRVSVMYEDETFWLSQKRMSELFVVQVNTVNYHLKEIFKSGELDENSVIRKIRIAANDGKDYLISFYNLDAIIAVGYRVNSYQATRFRIWATTTLREFIVIPVASATVEWPWAMPPAVRKWLRLSVSPTTNSPGSASALWCVVGQLNLASGLNEWLPPSSTSFARRERASCLSRNFNLL